MVLFISIEMVSVISLLSFARLPFRLKSRLYLLSSTKTDELLAKTSVNEEMLIFLDDGVDELSTDVLDIAVIVLSITFTEDIMNCTL